MDPLCWWGLGVVDLDGFPVSSTARSKRPEDYVVNNALPKNDYSKFVKPELRNFVKLFV